MGLMDTLKQYIQPTADAADTTWCDITAHAAQQDPNIVDRLGRFYAQHPDLVKGLGGMAVAVLLGKMANHSK